jgi:hypothetical protein
MLRIRKQREATSGHEAVSGWTRAHTLSTGALDNNQSAQAQEVGKALPGRQALI